MSMCAQITPVAADERCETLQMIFGEGFSAPATVAPANWIESACRGAWATVGALVPSQYPMILRVGAPDPMPGDWWSAYRAIEPRGVVGIRRSTIG